jgi:dihydroflavonol-4-reductase
MPMTTVAVTGATGLIGSNVCEVLRRRGDEVRALVRAGSDAAELERLGVEVVRGDVVERADVLAAVAGAEYVVHTAALVVGGPAYPYQEYERVNVVGSRNVFDAAAECGAVRTIWFTTGIADLRRAEPAAGGYPNDPYFSTKLEVARDGLRRSELGQDIVELSPGATFGPAPTGSRGVVPPGFNSRIVLAVSGELDEMPTFGSEFNLASDVAATTVGALERGRAGERYDLGCRLDDVVDTVTFLNMACEAAGVDHRVRPLSAAELDTDEAIARFGPSVVGVARRWARGEAREPSPARVAATEVLGHEPVPVRQAVAATVEWMRGIGVL